MYKIYTPFTPFDPPTYSPQREELADDIHLSVFPAACLRLHLYAIEDYSNKGRISFRTYCK
jgi:hypothetical protein